MHDHTEPSQSAQGGNYGLGMMSGIHFIGDRNTPGGVTTFPNGEIDYHGPSETGPAAGPEKSHEMANEMTHPLTNTIEVNQSESRNDT